jgi:segregation and condensation protein A
MEEAEEMLGGDVARGEESAAAVAADAPGPEGPAAETQDAAASRQPGPKEEPAQPKEEPEVAMLNVAGARPAITTERGEGGEELNLHLGEFAGPLDLLLYLIRQEQVDIYDIPVARITDEYLRYIQVMKQMDITVVSEFLVMAAQLIEIKSKMLLPPDPLAAAGEEDGEDPRKELIDRLLEHQKFKAAAQMLWSRATVEQGVFTRAPIETDKSNPEVAVGVFDLLRVFQEILARKKQEVLMEIGADARTPPQHDPLGRRAEPAPILRARRVAPRARPRLPLRARTRPLHRGQAHAGEDLRRHLDARRELNSDESHEQKTQRAEKDRRRDRGGAARRGA